MGEYIQLDGVGYKIGTCEDLYYVRYADLAEWTAAGRTAREPGNLEPARYLEGKFRFRFPFPDEDGDERARKAKYHGVYDRGVTLSAPAELFDDVEHRDISQWLTSSGDRPERILFYVTCPWSTHGLGGIKHGPIPKTRSVQIVQQRPIEGQLWTVVACPWCNTLWRLTPERAERLAAHIREQHPDDGLRLGIAARILAGYEPLPEPEQGG